MAPRSIVINISQIDNEWLSFKAIIIILLKHLQFGPDLEMEEIERG